MKKRILIYTPASFRTVEQQSQAELLIKNGFEVYLLTWASPGALHENFKELGAQTFSADTVKGRSFFFLIKQSFFLRKFCRENKIDYIFSHSQGNAVVSGLAHYFIRSKVFYCRHNSDYYSLISSRKYKFINKLANRLSPAIIAPSRKVKEQLLKERVPEKKIYLINYCYNFSQYWKDTRNAAVAIREKYKSDLLLLMVSRLDPLKRHLLAFEAVKKLADKGVDCKLVSIGDGEMRDRLQQWIIDNKMGERIFLEPFQTNTIDYYQACDVLIHLSYSEASCNVTKEAGICDKTVVVCRDVGDFDDYMQQGVNAFIVNKEEPVAETVQLLMENYRDKELLHKMGRSLHEKIISAFSIPVVEKEYQKILNE